MMFQSKLDRAMAWLKDKNKDQKSINQNDTERIYDEDQLDYYDPRAEWLAEENDKVHLEKGDLLAIIISAFLVFSPIILFLILILILVIKL
ncbi:MAG: hypothetical protein GX300_04010 [Tissierellia bacterium]|nr:hypothetical protein [Tissierellia bacterium]